MGIYGLDELRRPYNMKVYHKSLEKSRISKVQFIPENEEISSKYNSWIGLEIKKPSSFFPKIITSFTMMRAHWYQ